LLLFLAPWPEYPVHMQNIERHFRAKKRAPNDIGPKEGIERHIGPKESIERHIHGGQLYLNTQDIWPKQAISPGGGGSCRGKNPKRRWRRG
jgi:hypothetical protein